MLALKRYILDCLWLLLMVFLDHRRFRDKVKRLAHWRRGRPFAQSLIVVIVTPILLTSFIGLLLEVFNIPFNFKLSLIVVATVTTASVAVGTLNKFAQWSTVVVVVVVAVVNTDDVLGRITVFVAVVLTFAFASFDRDALESAEFGYSEYALRKLPTQNNLVWKEIIPGILLLPPFFVSFGVTGGVLFGVTGGVARSVMRAIVRDFDGKASDFVGYVMLFGSLFMIYILFIWLILLFFSSTISFLCEMLTTPLLLRQAIRQPHQAAQFLQQSPAYLDEAMLLPQPLLWRLVVAAGEADFEAGMRAITYLFTNTHQYRAAERAFLELGSRELMRHQSVAEIAECASYSHWLSSYGRPSYPLSSSVAAKQITRAAEAFTQCRKIAVEIASAVASTSDYRKLTTLHRARKRLEDFRQSAVLSLRGRERQNFTRIAQQWLAAVDTELDRLSREEGEIKRIPNPYLAPNPLGERSEMFLGRHAAARFLEEHFLRAGESAPIVLYGQPRIGKTSLLRNLEQRLTTDLIPVYVDMQRSAQVESIAGLLFNLAKTIAQELGARGVHVQPPALEAFASEPFIVFDNFLDEIERTIRVPENRVILALDEFEEIEKKLSRGTLSEDLMAYLRGMMQSRRGIRLLFAGTHTLDEMISGLWTPYFRSAVPCRISYLDEASARKLITNPIKEFPLEYDPEAVELLLAQTHCHPCLIQLTCSVLVDERNARKSHHAAVEEVEQAIDKVVKETGEYVFRGIWDWIPAGEQRLLAVLAANEPLTAAQLTAALGHSRVEVAAMVERLVENELVVRDETGCRFQVALLRRWVVRHAARTGIGAELALQPALR